MQHAVVTYILEAAGGVGGPREKILCSLESRHELSVSEMFCSTRDRKLEKYDYHCYMTWTIRQILCREGDACDSK